MKYVKSLVDTLKETKPDLEGHSFDILDGIIRQAVANTIESNPEYITRHIYRQYSKIFNTPLHQVYDLPFIFVFQNFIEHKIESEFAAISEMSEKLEYIQKYVRVQSEEEEARDLEDFIRFVEENFVDNTKKVPQNDKQTKNT